MDSALWVLMSCDTIIQVFPNMLLEGNFGFAPADLFATTETERADLKVSFEKKNQ